VLFVGDPTRWRSSTDALAAHMDSSPPCPAYPYADFAHSQRMTIILEGKVGTMADTAIFDVDGTLVDTNYHHALAWSRALNRYGITRPIWRIHRDPDRDTTEDGQVRAVGQATHDRKFRRAPAGPDSDQEVGFGARDRGEQHASGEVTISQQKHPGSQTP
jgi:hypothetical protein